MAGQLAFVGSAMTTNAGIGVFIGQGSEVFVGAGGAYIRNVSFSVNIGVHFFSEHAVGFYVAGKECEVKTKESEEHALYLFEKGYGICSHKYGEEGEVESRVVVQGLRGRQRFGGWRGDVDPLHSGPATLYIGPNVSTCALCGLQGVQATGPGVEEGGACPTAGAETRACPVAAAAAPAPASVLATTGISGTTTTTTMKILGKGGATGNGKKGGGLFGFGGRLRRFLEGGSAASLASEGQPFVFPSEPGDGDHLPDTHVLIVDVIIWCSPNCDGASSGSVQSALEQTWLAGLEDGQEDSDGARVVVVPYRSPSALKVMLGIGGQAAEEESGKAEDADVGRALASKPASCAGAQELVFVAYAHTTDKATADRLKARVKARGAEALNTTLATALGEAFNRGEGGGGASGGGGGGGGAAAAVPCAVNATLRQTFFVPAPVSKQRAGVQPLGSENGGTDFTMLPRVWINITAPVVEVGKAYDITISHFDQDDRVGLQLVPSSPSASANSDDNQPLFFQTAPRLLHTFKGFDAAKGNATWTWEVSALLAKSLGAGPFFLKAFDTKDQGRFVLSQAFDIDVDQEGGRWQRQRRRASSRSSSSRSSSSRSSSTGHAILRRLSSLPSQRRDQEAEEAEEGVDDVTLMRTVLSADKDLLTTADLWHALLALPSAKKGLGDAALAQALLAKTPVLQTAPQVLALDEGDGWKNPTRVQAAMSAAIRTFMDMALATMRQTPSTASRGAADRHWPTRILDSLSPQEVALAGEVAREGDVDALGELMDSQAARHFGGECIAYVSKEEEGGGCMDSGATVFSDRFPIVFSLTLHHAPKHTQASAWRKWKIRR
jgi:hypothetical protein